MSTVSQSPDFKFFFLVCPPTLTNQDSAGSGYHIGNGGAGKTANSSAPGFLLYCQTGQVIKKKKETLEEKKEAKKKAGSKKKESSKCADLKQKERIAN